MSNQGSRQEPVLGHVQPRSAAALTSDPGPVSADPVSLIEGELPAPERAAAPPQPVNRTPKGGQGPGRGSVSFQSPYGGRSRRTVRSTRLDARNQSVENSRNRWLVSYADFMTLLLGFFVVMYAISSVNEEKYQQMSKTFAGIFENSSMSLELLPAGDVVIPVTPITVDAPPDRQRDRQALEGDTGLLTSREFVASELGGILANDGLDIAANENWLEISLDSAISFEPDSAELKPEAQTYLQEISRWLSTFDNPVTVEGYTDNVPVNGRRFASNWQLSSARASSVAAYLATGGIDAKRVSAVGYGENHPVATNASPEGRAQNRRVVIVVAHKGTLPRNLNAAPETSAFALVRHGDDSQSEVPQRRTKQGGLLFSNE